MERIKVEQAQCGGALMDDYVECLTILFVPKEGKGYHTIRFYCRRCGEELDGVRHHDVHPPYIELECCSCGWRPGSQQEAIYELQAVWDEFVRA